jgi:3-dehydroquinate synthase
MNSKPMTFAKIPTTVHFHDHLFSSQLIGPQILWIVDQIVINKNPKLKNYLKKEKYVYAVKAGETLKDIKSFPQHIAKILQLANGLSHHHLTIVTVGGGSVGDFAGFVASTFKRGVPFIQIPTTWLAAIDSAHGGKNALNVGPFKNQIGTFYHPQNVYIIKDLLMSQPKARLTDALGEIYKMALIDNKSWGKKCLAKSQLKTSDVWSFLPDVIQAKYSVVQKDPLEKKGIRFILNFGHTLAHALELQYKIGHGLAVSCGIKFALWLSFKKRILSASEYAKIKNTAMYQFMRGLPQYQLTSLQFTKFLQHDKKKDKNDRIKFVFLKKIGRAQVAPISIAELTSYLNEYRKI